MEVLQSYPKSSIWSARYICPPTRHRRKAFGTPLVKIPLFTTVINLAPNVPLVSAFRVSWWRHQIETFSALLAFCAGNLPVTGEFPAQRPVTRSFDVFFDLCLNERFSKQSWGWWFDTPSRPLWLHCSVTIRRQGEYINLVPANTIAKCAN